MSIRLDRWLVTNGVYATRERAQAAILAGDVLVDGVPATGCAVPVRDTTAVRVRRDSCPYVSRGGLKLAHALDTFGVRPAGRVALDVGASTGGFTDCLLRGGAQRVYAVDVGYGQFAYALRIDPRVCVMERTNARYLEPAAFDPLPSLATVDVSFISATKVLPAILSCVETGGDIVLLVKPQFEVGRSRVGRGGVVRDQADHRFAIELVIDGAYSADASVLNVTHSPLVGPRGNREFWLHIVGGSTATPISLDSAISQAVARASELA